MNTDHQVEQKLSRLLYLQSLKEEERLRSYAKEKKKTRVVMGILIGMVLLLFIQGVYVGGQYHYLKRDFSIMEDDMNKMAAKMRSQS